MSAISAPAPDAQTTASDAPARGKEDRPDGCFAVLELAVKNHPGALSHVCGLFARRAYNLEAMACLPTGDGKISRLWLLVHEDERLPQVIKQVRKLEDVAEVIDHGSDRKIFVKLEGVLLTGEETEATRQESDKLH